jgi:tRNA(fMet)-specific endonuclease VapC
MTNYLLDTNHASPLVTLDHPLRLRWLAAVNSGHTFALATVTLTELVYGFGILPRAAQNQQEWARLRPSFRIYAIDEEDALKAAELQIHLWRRGWQLQTVDALLAVIAIRNDSTILTADHDFDAVPDLRCENWLAS